MLIPCPLYRPFKCHRSGIEYDHVICHIQRKLRVVFDEDNGQTAGLERSDGSSHLGNNAWREAFRRLVHQ